jgi:hypothetical protein
LLSGRGEDAEAAKVLTQLGSSADQKAVARIADEWAQHDPRAAADWAISQKPGSAQNRALAGVVGSWANEDPQAVEEWLAQFPPSEARDRSVAAFLLRHGAFAAGGDKRIAEFDRWFDQMEDPWQRAQVARESFQQRKRIDPIAARAWLAALPNVDPELIRMTLRDNRE